MSTRFTRRVVRAVLLAGGCAGLLLLTSCSAARSYLSVAAGNYAYEKGSYQNATVDYLNAAKSDAYGKWIAYDLGNVYHALGEPEGASAEWAKAGKAPDPRLAASTLFNEGVLDYELGRYRDAYDRFRKVLEIDPGDIDAKINLELSFAKMTTHETPPSAGSQTQPVTVKKNNTQANQILDIVRRRQDGIFTPPQQQQTKPPVADW